jgi:integrase/recombinase XerC
VDTKLHPHLLRHTYATELLEGSKDIRLVAQALGHSDVRVTMRYTERGNEEVASALEHTRNRKDSGS